ncbi:hypothetical protein tb265_35820 [Gemmatimonadetes bacterium T265]|nr:hypothetical protein tb265_35820 [Gemmatimonadetes bacterium T265]
MTRRGAGRRLVRVAAAALVAGAGSGCLATHNDVLALQLDLANARREALRADSARAASVDARLSALEAAIRALADTVAGAGQRASHFEGDAREQLRAVREQLIQVQELTGQSQRRLQDLRASLDARTDAVAPSPAPATPPPPARSVAVASDSPPPARLAPGAAELYRVATQQLRRGSYGTARVALTDLLRRYPDSELAPDAEYALAESYAGERNTGAADSVYNAVVTRYPESPRAATALYKRARARQDAGRRADARAIYDELLRRYPHADEATLARDAIRAMTPRRGP